MDRYVRAGLVVATVLQAVVAVGLFVQHPALVALWPFEGTTPLTFIFLSSIFAAAAASQLWILYTGHYGALAGIALDYMTILVPVGFFALQRGGATGNSALTNYGLLCLLGAAAGFAALRWSLRVPLDTSIPTPRLVRGSFAFFILALAIVSGRLLLQIPTIPWQITPDLSILIACMFIGAGAYFAYGVYRPYWSNAGGQLAGFLAYDLVLIWPFVSRLATVPEEHRVRLWIYTAVVIYSGLLAIYYLFVSRETRLGARIGS